MFRASGIQKTVVAAFGTDHTIWGASFFKHDQIWSPYLVTFEEACSPDSTTCTPEAATAVLCTPDDGCDGRPKQVQ